MLLLASIVINISQYQQFKKLSIRPVTEKITKNKHVIDSKSDSAVTPSKISQKSTTPASKETKPDTSEIDRLEYYLRAAEEELIMTYEQLDEELYKKAEYKKARDLFAKSMSSLSNTVNRKRVRDSLTQILGNDYDPLYKKLSLSEEEFNEFKDILVDERMELEDLYASRTEDSSNEEVEKLTLQEENAIVLCSPAIRMYLKQLLDRFLPQVIVLSYNELEPTVQVQSVGVVNVA